MWNPAAPQPMTNPPQMQGAPPPGASQQFWPQWQAAVQYYQAASAPVPASGTEQSAAGKGMVFVVHMCLTFSTNGHWFCIQ